MLPDLISLRKGVALLLLATCVDAFSCSLDVGSIHYDISPLSGLRVAEQKDTPTPPTTNDAMVRMDLCSEDGLQKEEGIDDRDQCGSNTKVCLKFINHKASDSNPDRVTAVIPIWPMDVSDDDIRTEALGKNGLDGLSIQVYGPEYAGNQQRLNLTLLCDPDAQDSNPEFSSYSSNQLSLTWATPDACPRTPGEEIPPAPDTSKGMGLWGFIKFMFWLIVFSLALYFGIGIFYNHQQYSAKGWDLIPHRDFWREFPALIQDLFSHVFAGLKGGGGGGSSGRGGYSSLG